LSTLRAARTAPALGLAARAALPPQPAHLEHLLPRTVRKRDRPAPNEPVASTANARRPGGALVDEFQSLRVAVAARGDGRLEDNHSADHVHDREPMRVAVRVDTDDIVQLIRKHPKTDLQPKRWGHNRCRSGVETAGGRTVAGHALTTRTGF
jgi:hypothetical protein